MSHEDGSRQRPKGPISPDRNVDSLASVMQRAAGPPAGTQAASSASPVSSAQPASIGGFVSDTERTVGWRTRKKKRAEGASETDSQEDPTWIPGVGQAQGLYRTSSSHRPSTRQRLSEPSNTPTTRLLLRAEYDRDQFSPPSEAAGQGDVGDQGVPDFREQSRHNRPPDNSQYPVIEAAATTLLSLRFDSDLQPDSREDRSRQPSGATTQADTARQGLLRVSSERLAEGSPSPLRRQRAAVTSPLTDSPLRASPSNVASMRQQSSDPISAAAQRKAASQRLADAEEAPRGFREFQPPQTTQSSARDLATLVESLGRPPQEERGAVVDAATERDIRRDGPPQETDTDLLRLAIRISQGQFRPAEDQRNAPSRNHTTAERMANSSTASQAAQQQNPQAQENQQVRQLVLPISGSELRQVPPPAQASQSKQAPLPVQGSQSRQVPPAAQASQIPLPLQASQSRQVPPAAQASQSRQAPLSAQAPQSRQAPPPVQPLQFRQVPPSAQGSQLIRLVMIPAPPLIQQPTQQARQSMQHQQALYPLPAAVPLYIQHDQQVQQPPQMPQIAAQAHAHAIHQLQQLQQAQNQRPPQQQQLLQPAQQASPLVAQQLIMQVQQRLSRATMPALVHEQHESAQILGQALWMANAQTNQSTHENTRRRLEIQRIRDLANRAQASLDEIKAALSELN